MGIISDDTTYNFDENGNLRSIIAFYSYFDESEKEQMSIDLDRIKQEISKYYPENTITRIDETNDKLFLFTENRMISLTTYDDDAFDVYITTTD